LILPLSTILHMEVGTVPSVWYFCLLIFDYLAIVCSSSIYGFWLPLWCLQTLFRVGKETRRVPLLIRIRFSVLYFSGHCLSFSFDHCIVCLSLIYFILLPLWYLQTFHSIEYPVDITYRNTYLHRICFHIYMSWHG
jgi:hypothetical protein